MKKLFLLLAGGALAVGANAQVMKHDPSIMTNTRKQPFVNVPVLQNAANAPKHQNERTTSVVFWTEDFHSGTPTTLPTGWTAGTLAGPGTWHWTNVASSSTYSIGAMNSTTASNGWMIFDSDSLGAVCGTCAPSGYLQSPLIDCHLQPTVRLNFEDYYRSYYDSCSVWVSTSPTFTTYQDFPVTLNDGLAPLASTANPATVQINISSVAASQAAVYIRFVYYGYPAGSYSWLIDDVSLSSLDPVDIGLSKSCVIYNYGSGPASFGVIPAKMMDTLYPVSFAANYGSTAEPSVNVNAQIYQGSTSVYNKNITLNLPVNAADSLADFSQSSVLPGYYSTTMANYLVPFTTSVAGDAVAGNNLDTAGFIVSDTTWSENPVRNGSINIVSGSYVHRPSSLGSVLSWGPGTGFAVAAGQVDTLTSVSVAFSSSTVAGQVVGVQIYHFDASATVWNYDGLTTFRALAPSDISTSGTLKYATFVVDEVSSSGPIILNGGATGVTYAAIVKGNNNTDVVELEESNNPADFSLVSYVGLSDTSSNDGAASQDFGNGHLPYGEAYTPLINLNFGPQPLAVRNINFDNSVGKAYPNPANTSVNIPFTMSSDASVTVTLTNVVGQEMKSQQIKAIGGKPMTATFATSDLTAGVYIYTVEANGEHATGRIVIAR